MDVVDTGGPDPTGKRISDFTGTKRVRLGIGVPRRVLILGGQIPISDREVVTEKIIVSPPVRDFSI